ncbi:MAG: replicative DNA helicase [Planctomycetes bacterium RBG_13_63_9]|nr:MAG: replicative DNA helicase [Planctomycetes bacterium RBG_13_63_9]
MATVDRTDSGRATSRVSSEILDRLPPQNLEAERGVLGSLLLVPEMCDEVALIVRADDFHADANRKLFGHLIGMHEEGKRIDATLLVERLRQAGDLEAIGGEAYLGEVAGSVPYAANATYYAEIVREKATLRALIHASTEILRDAYDETVDPTEVVSTSEQRIFAVHDSRSTDQVTTAHDLMIEALDRIDARLAGTEGVGIPTGFKDLDNRTGGLHDSELVILAARPSMGKTALATNMAEYVTMEGGVPTLFVSLEMARLELAQRMLCSQGRIDANKFRSGFISSADQRTLAEASSKLSQAPLFIDDSPSRTVTEIAACARRLKRKQNLGLLVIDYLQLLHPDDPRDPRQEQVAKMARRLKCLARELKIPVLCLSQLNRQAEAGRESHRPRLSHLRESGAIEQDADVVIFIHRDEAYMTREEAEQQGKKGIAEIIVAKQRNGPTGEDKLAWFDKYTRFENLSEQPHEEFASYEDSFQ